MQGLAFIALVLLVFAGLFAGLQLWSAYGFGWSSLARAYRLSGPFPAQHWRLNQCRLARMRWAGFEESLKAFFPHLPRDLPDEVFGTENLELDIGGNPEGLYLAGPSRLQFWRPPLFIPWNDIAVGAEKVHWLSYLTPHRRIVITWRGAPVEGGWVDCLVFRFRKAPGVLLQLNEDEARPLIAAAGSSWPELVPSQSIPTAS
jgi:hypothetical protein